MVKYEQYTHKDGVYLMTAEPAAIELHYIDIREKEGRLLSDEAVRNLPVSPSAAHQQEWQYRKFSADRLIAYLQNKERGHVLDLGCGNGWFTHSLTLKNGNSVLGLDVNMMELQQAARLFGTENCRFAYGDIFKVNIPEASFRYIVINSAIQYFPDLLLLLNRLLSLLAPEGEIHILDSPFYDPSAIAAAAKRSRNYYENAGTPEMAAFYHHHTWKDLDNFRWKLMYDPRFWWHSLKRKAGYPNAIFPWIRITQAE